MPTAPNMQCADGAGQTVARDRKGPAVRGRPRYDITDNKAAQAFAEFAKTCTFNRGSTIPLWVQVKSCLENVIENGTMSEGARLPSEKAMCETFSLSRPVIRLALSALASDGLIVKEARRGMFVATQSPKIGFMATTSGVFSDLTRKGHSVEEKTYAFDLTNADAEENRVFRLLSHQKIIRILRVYSVDSEPLTHTLISLPAHRLPGMEKLNIEGRSIFETIRLNYGLRPQRADRSIRCSAVSAAVANRMKVEPGTPMLEIESVAYDPCGNPLEFYRAYFNSAVAPLIYSTACMFEPSIAGLAGSEII